MVHRRHGIPRRDPLDAFGGGSGSGGDPGCVVLAAPSKQEVCIRPCFLGRVVRRALAGYLLSAIQDGGERCRKVGLREDRQTLAERSGATTIVREEYCSATGRIPDGDPFIVRPALLVCGSGDDFATGDEASHFDCVDMGGHALSLICQRENVPFACLKYISDGADDGADTDWNESLKTAAKALRKALEEAEL